jgi:hypothetical protein
MFFFEKKNQKTFGCSRIWSGQTVAAQGPGETEVFCFFFLKKKGLLFG